MQAELISIGTELLLGEITDTNATFIAQKLRQIGLDLIYRTTVGDNEQRIAEVIDHALNRVDVVITSGGLGPTVDDVTREAIARATGRPLELRQELLDAITEKFRRFGISMSDNNRRQAYAPQGALVIDNPVGTAPIFILETERGVIMTLPGVPREMSYLLENYLLPWLREYIGSPAVIKSRTLRTAGIGESQIDARISDLMTGSNPTVALAAHSGQTDVRITAKAGSEAEADSLLDPLEAEIRKRIGRWIYGTGSDTVEEVVERLLQERNASIACLEIGTGGTLKERLKQAQPGLALDQVDELERFGVSPQRPIREVAEAAAQAIRGEGGTDYGLALIAMPGPSSPDQPGTAMAIATANGCRSQTFVWRNERSDMNIWATTFALAFLHRQLRDSGSE